MNSKIGQQLQEIQQSIFHIQDCYTRAGMMTGTLIDKIESMELVVSKDYFDDLCKARHNLQTLQSSQAKAINDQIIKETIEIIQNSLYCYHQKNELPIQNYINEMETFQTTNSGDQSGYMEKEFRTDESEVVYIYQPFTSSRNFCCGQDQIAKDSPETENHTDGLILERILRSNSTENKPIISELESESQDQSRNKGYNTASIDQRAYAISLAQEKGIKFAAKETGFPTRNIKRWLKAGPSRKKGCGRKALDSNMEDDLFKWLNEEQKRTGQLPSSSQIKKKAKKMSNVPDFKASKGWVENFRRRYNVKALSALSETHLANTDDLDFGEEPVKLIKKESHPNDAIILSEQEQKIEKDEIFQDSQNREEYLNESMPLSIFLEHNFISISNDAEIPQIRISLDQDFFIKRESFGYYPF